MTLLEELKSYLLELGCRPGEKIPTEMELAAHFKVSRGKVREATTALCLQGVLDKKARRGTVIKSLDPDSAGSDLLFRFSLSDIDPADFKEARRVIERAIMLKTLMEHRALKEPHLVIEPEMTIRATTGRCNG